MNDPQIFREVKCGVCKKKVSSRLCDFVIGYNTPSFFRKYEDFKEQELHQTCDLPLCDECTKEYNNIYDFCPHHFPFIEKIKPTDEMQRSIGEYWTRELQKNFETNGGNKK